MNNNKFIKREIIYIIFLFSNILFISFIIFYFLSKANIVIYNNIKNQNKLKEECLILESQYQKIYSNLFNKNEYIFPIFNYFLENKKVKCKIEKSNLRKIIQDAMKDRNYSFKRGAFCYLKNKNNQLYLSLHRTKENIFLEDNKEITLFNEYSTDEFLEEYKIELNSLIIISNKIEEINKLISK